MSNDDRAKYLHGQPYNITVDQKFRLFLRLLRREFPVDPPVRCRRLPSEKLEKCKANGYTYLANDNKPKNKQYFVIVINRNMDWHKQIDTIMHEWAHAMTWYVPSSQDHNREWANAYGKIYRRLIED